MSVRTAHARYIELDALRGIAAFTVVVYHLTLAFSYYPRWLISALLAGKQAVILFFVLSGFVLSLPFWNKGTNGAYGKYLTRRFFRIWVPFAAALLLSTIGAHFFLHSQLPLGRWFHLTWQTDLTLKFLLSQLFFSPTSELNTAFWSLRYEVQLSIAFPFILILLRKMGRPVSLFVALFVSWLALRLSGHYEDVHYYQETMAYGAMFVIGALIAWSRSEIALGWQKAPPFFKAAFATVSFCCYFWGTRIADRVHKGHFGDSLTASGACGVMILAMNFKWMRRVLRHPLPEYLGRISFSMYLIHGTVLFVLVNLLYGQVSVWVIGSFL